MKEQMVEYPVSSLVTWEEAQNVARRIKVHKSLRTGTIISIDSCPGSKRTINRNESF